MERKIGESITLEADPNYRWIENVPYMDSDTGEKKTKEIERQCEIGKVKFLIVPDDLTRLAMLETGELDLISDILPQYVKRLERNKHIKVKRELTAPSYFAVALRPDNYPILKDTNFSNSFNYAINRQEIVDKIFLGEGYPMYMYASKSELGYDPKITYEFDPDRARELIKKSYIRQERIKVMVEEIEEKVLKKMPEPIIFEGDKDWPILMAGPAASKICHIYKKPVFLYSQGKTTSQGAVRTPLGLDGVKAMMHCSKLLETYGGHPRAAGFRVKNKDLQKFKQCLTHYFKS